MIKIKSPKHYRVSVEISHTHLLFYRHSEVAEMHVDANTPQEARAQVLLKLEFFVMVANLKGIRTRVLWVHTV